MGRRLRSGFWEKAAVGGALRTWRRSGLGGVVDDGPARDHVGGCGRREVVQMKSGGGIEQSLTTGTDEMR